MKVDLEVSSWFKRFTSGKPVVELELPDGTSAKGAAASAGIPANEVGFISINGCRADGDSMLKDGDRLKVYPVIIGG